MFLWEKRLWLTSHGDSGSRGDFNFQDSLLLYETHFNSVSSPSSTMSPADIFSSQKVKQLNFTLLRARRKTANKFSKMKWAHLKSFFYGCRPSKRNSSVTVEVRKDSYSQASYMAVQNYYKREQTLLHTQQTANIHTLKARNFSKIITQPQAFNFAWQCAGIRRNLDV